MMRLSFTVNGESRDLSCPPMRRLLDVLREDLNLKGTKEGCGEGECGACAVIMDGLLVLSCMIPACQINGKNITTIEGVASGGELHPIQLAFHENGGAQCGICTPGMILAALYYQNNPNDAEDLREALAGNQCRCTGYMGIFRSVEATKSK
jgi:carbon-monoxide dehydrogenase small subunit